MSQNQGTAASKMPMGDLNFESPIQDILKFLVDRAEKYKNQGAVLSSSCANYAPAGGRAMIIIVADQGADAGAVIESFSQELKSITSVVADSPMPAGNAPSTETPQ